MFSFINFLYTVEYELKHLFFVFLLLKLGGLGIISTWSNLLIISPLIVAAIVFIGRKITHYYLMKRYDAQSLTNKDEVKE